MFAEPFRKLPRVLALPALVAAHVQRLSDQQGLYVPFQTNLLQVGEVLTDAGSVQGLDAVSTNAGFSANSQADALLADVESQYATGRDEI